MKEITKQQIEELQQQNRSVKLIDIRTPEEYDKMHVPGAVNIVAESLSANDFTSDANETIVCICNKGQERSQNAAATLTNMGLSNVYYLKDGTFGWLSE